MNRTLLIAALFTMVSTGCGGGGGEDVGNDKPMVDETPTITEEETTDPEAPVDEPTEGETTDPEASVDEPTEEEPIVTGSIYSVKIAGARGFVTTGDASDTLSTASNFTMLSKASKWKRIRLSAASTEEDSLSAANTEEESASNFTDPNTIYKITDDGRLERLKIIDSSGVEVARGELIPLGVDELTPDFVVIAFEVAGIRKEYLVHRETERAYDISEIKLYWDDPTQPTARDYTDNGDLYIRPLSTEEEYRSSYGVIPISGLQNNNLQYISLPKANDLVDSFNVERNGQYVIYTGQRKDNRERIVRFLDLASGNISTIESDRKFFQSQDRHMYVGGLGEDGNSYARVNFDSEGNWTHEELKEFKVTAVSGILDYWSPAESLQYAESIDLRIVGGVPMLRLKGNLMPGEFNPDTGELVIHDTYFGSIGTIHQKEVTENFIWTLGSIDGNDAIVQYDPVTRESQTIAMDSNIEIATFDELSDDRLYFEGYSFQYDATVRGELSIDGEITITHTDASQLPFIKEIKSITPADLVAVDGNPQEWSTVKRIFSDVGDETNEYLVHYSEMVENERYYGLIELAGALEATDQISIEVSQTHKVILSHSGATLHSNEQDTFTALREVGGRVSIGESVEFMIPVAAFGTVSPNATQIGYLIEEAPPEPVEGGSTDTGEEEASALVVVDQLP